MSNESEWTNCTPLEAHQAFVAINIPKPQHCRRGIEGYDKTIRLEFATAKQRDAALSAIRLAMGAV